MCLANLYIFVYVFKFLHCLFLLIVVLLIFFYIFAYMLMKGKIILGIKYVDEILRNQNVRTQCVKVLLLQID